MLPPFSSCWITIKNARPFCKRKKDSGCLPLQRNEIELFRRQHAVHRAPDAVLCLSMFACKVFMDEVPRSPEISGHNMVTGAYRFLESSSTLANRSVAPGCV
eukprot:gnl/Spiro4/10611_TR5673_c0_g1_i1.p2 gnl/Spiro4/10611_TR5673_c0_g1~~gnl/Spiro4/10611_TR5673_c0_g1_i1.p2  ORF type:complete len:102 (-),score=2.24 gnl/Spiro4/10611_TR5673_c0_g1_i1:132-437(-)